jgi:hypothetical protein
LTGPGWGRRVDVGRAGASAKQRPTQRTSMEQWLAQRTQGFGPAADGLGWRMNDGGRPADDGRAEASGGAAGSGAEGGGSGFGSKILQNGNA